MQTQRTIAFCEIPFCGSYTHVAAGHFCRLCKQFGHAFGGCLTANQLVPLLDSQLPTDRWCTITDCPRPSNHSTEAHFCVECKKVVPCRHIHLGLSVGLRTLDAKGVEKVNIQDKIFDNQKLVRGLQIACPTCRTQNRLPIGQSRVFTVDDSNCIVCQSLKIEIFLPQCGHTQLCGLCAIKIGKFT